MISFPWKRKLGGQVSKETIEAFNSDAMEETCDVDDDVSPLSKRKLPDVVMCALEDVVTKKARLHDEGCFLAENERYWEALRKWDEALQLCPNEEKLYEMKSQVLLELGEVFPAIQSAERAVQLSPNWWIAHQTLGRAQLSAGEVERALRSFSAAFHLKPDEKALREDDLLWALALMTKCKELGREKKLSSDSDKTCTIREVTSEENDKEIVLADSEVDNELIPVQSKSSGNYFTSKKDWIRMRTSLI